MKGKLVLGVMAVVVLLAVGGAGWMFLQMDGNTEDDPVEAAIPHFLTISNIVVNLRSEQQEIHYLQLEVAIQVGSQKYQDELVRYVPALRDALGSYFSSLFYEAMDEPGQREIMRKGALERVRGVAKEQLRRQRVDDLFLTSLVIQ